MISGGANSAVPRMENIIFGALDLRASDIYIQPHEAEVSIEYCIDGVWQPAVPPIAKEWHPTILSRLKLLSEMDVDRRGPQQGGFRVKYKGRYIDFGVSIAPARRGQDALLYLLNKEPADLRSKKE